MVNLTSWLVSFSGDNKLPTPKRPKLFVFGWPDISSATASMESISVNGTVQYDLFYNLTCPFVSDNDTACSTAVADLIPVDGCERVKNQLISSSKPKVLSCTICNNTEECASMRISRDHDLCLYLRVNTSFGIAHSCMESSVFYKISEYWQICTVIKFVDGPVIKINDHATIKVHVQVCI